MPRLPQVLDDNKRFILDREVYSHEFGRFMADWVLRLEPLLYSSPTEPVEQQGETVVYHDIPEDTNNIMMIVEDYLLTIMAHSDVSTSAPRSHLTRPSLTCLSFNVSTATEQWLV